jgi:hypothetical protein
VGGHDPNSVSPVGGGGNPSGGTGAGPNQPPPAPPDEDTLKSNPKADNRPANQGEDVAPDMPQSSLVLRKLEDMLRENKITSDIEKQTGMSKEEMEQFVKKYGGTPKAQPGEGRTIEVKPGTDKRLDPTRLGPEFNPGTTSSRSDRGAGSVVQDNERGNVQGNRSVAPPEIRTRLEAYKSSLSRSNLDRTPPRSSTPAKSAPDGGSGGSR